MIGAGLNFLPNIGGRWRPLFKWSGVFLVFVSIFFFPAQPNGFFPGWIALIPCLGAACLIAAPFEVGPLVSRPVVQIGQASYSIYLYHWPIWAFSRYLLGPGKASPSLALLLLVGVMGYASWRWIENPVRRRKVLSSNRQLLTFYVASSLTLAALGSAIYLTEGFPRRFPDVVWRYANSRQWDRSLTPLVTDAEAAALEFPTLGRTGSPNDFLLWGDSHAGHLSTTLDLLLREKHRSGFIACRNGYPAYEKLDEDYSGSVLRLVRTHKLKYVFLAFRWDVPLRAGCLTDAVRVIRDAGAHPIILSDLPSPGADVPLFLSLRSRYPALYAQQEMPLWSTWRTDRERWMKAALQGATGYDVVYFGNGLFSRDGRLQTERASYPLFWDTNHLTVAGANLLRPELGELLDKYP